MPTLRRYPTTQGDRWELLVRDHRYPLFKKRFLTEKEARDYFRENYPLLSLTEKRPRLDLEKRKLIEKWLKEGRPIFQIANELGYTFKAIKNEIEKNEGAQKYNAVDAELNCGAHRPKNNYDSRIESLEMQIGIILDELKLIKEKI